MVGFVVAGLTGRSCNPPSSKTLLLGTHYLGLRHSLQTQRDARDARQQQHQHQSGRAAIATRQQSA